jgi:ATP-binding cassette subfamily B protein
MENKKINIKENLKIYLDFLLKYKWIIFWILLFILIGEIIGLGEKFLFKILIDRGSEFYSDLISVEVFTTILKIIAIFFLVSVVVKSVARWMYLHLVTRLDSNLMKDLKEKVFTHIISLDYKFHTTHKTGSLISRMSRGGGAIETMSDVVLMNFSTTIIQLIVVTAS